MAKTSPVSQTRIYRRDLRADTVPYFFLPSVVVAFANFTCEPAGAAAGVFVLSFFGFGGFFFLRKLAFAMLSSSCVDRVM